MNQFKNNKYCNSILFDIKKKKKKKKKIKLKYCFYTHLYSNLKFQV